MRRTLLSFAPLLLCACAGPPLSSKEQLAGAVAQASIPAVGAKGARLWALGQAALPEPSFTVQGPHGGQATVSINPVGAALGIAAGGVLLDVQLNGFAGEDPRFRLDGRLSVVAQFDYRAAAGEDPQADLRLSLVGRLELSGLFWDELEVDLTLVTRFEELANRGEGIALHLEGKVVAREQTFSFEGEDLSVLWRAPER